MRFRKSTYSKYYIVLAIIFITKIAFSQMLAPVQFDIDSATGCKGDRLCVAVRVSNFIDVESMQFAISYNATMVQLECPFSVSNAPFFPELDNSNFNCSNERNGFIRFLYSTATSPLTVPDGSVLFEICFTIIGNPGNTTPIFINGIILDTEICQSPNGQNTVCTDEIVVNSGTVNIACSSLGVYASKCDADGVNMLNNASLTFYPTGGAAPYNYMISPGGYSGVVNTDAQRTTISPIPLGNYTITVTDNIGNTATTTINVSSNFPITYDPPIIKEAACFDRKNGSITINNVNGGIQPYLFQWSTFASGINLNTINNLETGTYFVTISDGTGCQLKDTIILTLDTLKTSVDILTPASCKDIRNGRIRLNASGGSPYIAGMPYEYSLNGGNWIKFTPPTIITNIGAGNFTVNIRDSVQCNNGLMTLTMGVQRVLDMQVIIDSITCPGANDATIIMTSSPYSNQYTFLPLIGYPSLGMIKSDSFTVMNVSPGMYGYRVIDQDGCRDTLFFDVIDPDSIKLNDVVVNPGCSNLGSITLNPTGGIAPYTFNWSPPQMGNPNALTNLNGGNYSVIVSDGNNCTINKSWTLNASGTLDIEAKILNPLSCQGNNDGRITVEIRSINGPFDITWTDENNTTISNQMTVSNLGAGTYTVVVVDAGGCSNTNTVTLTGAVGFTYNVVVNNAPCNGDLGSAFANVQGSVGQVTYDWKLFGQTQTIDTDNSLAAAAGTYILTISNQGCTKDTTILITEPQPIVFPAPSTRNTLCFGVDNGQAAIMSAPIGISYEWSSGEMGIFAIMLPEGNNWVIGTQGACKSDTVFFQIGSFPQLSLSPMSTSTPVSCFGGSDGSVMAVAQGGTGIGYRYLWQDPPLDQPVINNLEAGTYVVNIMDSNNCIVTDSIEITQPDALVASIDRIRTIELDCNNQDNGSIAINTTGGNPGLKTYTWPANVTANREVATGLSAGTYCATVTDNKGCSDTICYTLKSPTRLVGKVNTPTPPLCNGGQTCISIESVTGGTGNQYTFQINNGIRYPIDSCVTVFASTYTINIIDSAGCFIDTTITIAQPDPINVFLGPDLDIQLGTASDIISATIDTPFGIDTLVWTPSNTVICADTECRSVQFMPSLNTTYTLTVTDQQGCTGSDEITVTVKDVRNVYFANIFTPNQDGSNDFFQVVTGIGVEEVETFAVYDRWGNLMFIKENYIPDPAGVDGWDGTFGGRKLDPGVFVYYAKVRFIDGQQLKYSGSVTLAAKTGN